MPGFLDSYGATPEYNTGDNSPTWGDYGTLAKSSVPGLEASMYAAARYIADLQGDTLASDYAASSERLAAADRRATLDELSPTAKARNEASFDSTEFLSHPFSSLALKTAGMAAPIAASVLPGGILRGAISSAVGVAAAGGTLTTGDMLDQFYERVDDASEEELMQSSMYRGLRTMFDEKEARREYQLRMLKAKPVVAFILGAAANSVGLGGQVSRVARGGQAALGGAERGALARTGMAALEGAGSNAAEGLGTEYLVQSAHISGGLQEDFDEDALVRATLDPAILGLAHGTVAGGAGALLNRGGRKQVTPRVTREESEDAVREAGAPPHTGATGHAPPPPEDAAIGNPQSAPTVADANHIKEPKGAAAVRVSKKNDAKALQATRQEAPDTDVAHVLQRESAESNPAGQDPVVAVQQKVEQLQGAVQQEIAIGQQMAQELQQTAPQPIAPPVQLPAVTQGVTGVAPTLPNRTSGLPIGSPLQPPPVESPVQPVLGKPRVLEDVTPEAKQNRAALLKQQRANEKAALALPKEPGKSNDTTAEKAAAAERLAIAEEVTRRYAAREEETMKEALERAAAIVAEAEPLIAALQEKHKLTGAKAQRLAKIPSALRGKAEEVPPALVVLREAADLVKWLRAKTRAPKEIEARANKFRNASRAPDLIVQQRREEGDAAMKVANEPDLERMKAPEGAGDVGDSRLGESPEDILSRVQEAEDPDIKEAKESATRRELAAAEAEVTARRERARQERTSESAPKALPAPAKVAPKVRVTGQKARLLALEMVRAKKEAEKLAPPATPKRVRRMQDRTLRRSIFSEPIKFTTQERNKKTNHGNVAAEAIDKTTLGRAIAHAGAPNIGSGGVVSGMLNDIRDAILAKAKDIDVYVISDDEMQRLHGHNGGAYSPVHDHIVIAEDVLGDWGALQLVLAHEGTHAVTTRAMYHSPELTRRVRTLMDLVEARRPDLKKAYGFTNEQEFVAEAMSNRAFQQALRGIHLTVAEAKAFGIPKWWDGKLRTMFDAVVNIARVALGIDKASHSALAAAIKLTDDIASVQDRASNELAAVYREIAKRPARELDRRNAELLAPPSRVDAGALREQAGERATDFVTNSKARTRSIQNRLSSNWMLAYRAIVGGQEFQSKVEAVVELHAMMERSKSNILEREGGAEVVRALADFNRAHPEQIEAVATTAFEASNYNVNLGPNANNDHLGKDATTGWQAKKKLPELQKAYNWLSPEAKALLEKVVPFFKKMQDEMSLQTIRNVLKLADMDEPGLAERIFADGLTDADKEKLKTNAAAKAISEARGLKKQQGWYLPFRRYGDYIATGHAELTAPEGAILTSPNTVQFHNASDTAARKAAKAYAENHDLVHVDTKHVYVDKNDPTKIVEKEDMDAIHAYRMTFQTQHTTFHTNEAEAQRALDALKEAGVKTEGAVRVRRDEAHAKSGLMAGDLKTALSSLEQQQRFKDMDNVSKNALRQAFLEASVKVLGSTRIQSRFIQRRHVVGYSDDLPRVAAEYARASASQIAKLRYQPRIDAAFKALDDHIASKDDKLKTKRDEIRNELNSRMNEDQLEERPTATRKVIRRLLQISRLDKLAGVSFHVINSQEPWLASLPLLAGRHGVGSATGSMLNAYNVIGARGGLMAGLKDTVAAYSNDVGFTDYVRLFSDTIRGSQMMGGAKAQRLIDVLEYADKRGFFSNESMFEVSRYADPTSNVVGRAFDRADLMANQVGSAIEGINRAVTLIAAHDLEFKRNGGNHEAAMHYAFEVAHDAMGDYSSWNAAPIFKGNAGMLALQFKKFAHKMYYLLGKTIKRSLQGDPEAMKQFAGLMVTHAAVAGVLGLPLEPFKVALMAAGVLGATSYTWEDFEAEARRMSAQMLGNKGGELLTKGVTRGLGVEVSARQGLDSLLTYGTPRSAKANDLKAWLWDTLAGAPVGYLIEQAAVAQHLFKGEYAQAAEKFVPLKAYSDVSQAVRHTVDHKKTATGREQYGPYTPFEAVVRSVGFKPAGEAEATERRNTITRNERAIRDVKSLFEQQWYSATPNERAKLWGQIEKWNRAQPSNMRLTRAQLDRYVKNRGKEKLSGGVKETKQNRELVKGAEFYNYQ